MDISQPPTGVDVLRVKIFAVQLEQKSVPMLRDVIRQFTPNISDIAVDGTNRTMSTVVAFLYEGRPVYACDMEEKGLTTTRARGHVLRAPGCIWPRH
jgi:hypothetical protein